MNYARIRRSLYIFSQYPSKGQGIVGRVFKFAGYIYHYKILPGIFLVSFWKTRWPPQVFLDFQQGVLLALQSKLKVL